jgi:predicted molibdopterin-dependent oxidoreductase YjgC
VSEFPIRIDGVNVPARSGQSLAAVLLVSGRRSWRTTRIAGEPRGLFCGIGSCFDCLVTLNGRPNVRACVTLTEPGDVVVTQAGTGHE